MWRARVIGATFSECAGVWIVRAEPGALKAKRILVVDDNASSRELVKFALEPCYVVEEASDGRDAILRIQETLPDLVLMDIQMPDMDGYETLHQIRAHPASALVPVVALTAFAMLEDRQKAFEAGFDGYFAKPINIAALRTQVESLLNR
jgi:two-component system cell cycle response regulator DivK